jgi:hypothetical protein
MIDAPASAAMQSSIMASSPSGFNHALLLLTFREPTRYNSRQRLDDL